MEQLNNNQSQIQSTEIEMFPHTSGLYNPLLIKLNETASTWAGREQRDYLATVNYKLVVQFPVNQNEINDSETEKNLYKAKLSYQFRNHQDQLEEAFSIINERNKKIIDMEEEVDMLKKDLRAAADDYISLKRSRQDEKQFYATEMENMKAVCDEKIRKIEEECDRRWEVKLKKRVQEVQNECSDRIAMYSSQIGLLTENSKKLMHELSMLQEDYRQMLLKNDTIIQESIHRQLRKRDFQAQNNYLSDLGQYQSLKNQKNALKAQIKEERYKKELLEKEIRTVQAKLQVNEQRIKDLQETLQDMKGQEKVELFDKYKDVCDIQTNTEKQFVPIIMPVDLNIMSEVVSLRDFVVERLLQKFVHFYEKAAGSEKKKTSKSLMAFKNGVQQMKQRSSELKIILLMHTNLERIIKIYCPSLINLSREFLTIKDEFIKRTLLECQTIANDSQRLFRLLDLLFRIKSPINHLHPQVTAGELRLLQIKLLLSLKKVFA